MHERVGEIFNFGVLHLEWPTALYIFVVFIVTMFFLNFWLFRPILRTLEARRSVVDKNKEAVKNLTAAIEVSRKTYHEKLAKVQSEIQATYQQGVDQTKAEAQKMIEAAKNSAEEKLVEARAEIGKEREEALSQAASLTAGLGQAIKDKAFNS